MSKEQQEERDSLFGKTGGCLDYVSCWYKKSTEYMKGNQNTRAAFVSTNSICQGQQVEPLWKPLFDEGVKINFAHQSFLWGNEASSQAYVYVVIIGFSMANRPIMTLFTYCNYKELDEVKHVDNINGYLQAAPNVFISKRSKPICSVPPMIRGCQPTDGGNLIFKTEKEKADFIAAEPAAAEWIKPFSMGADFIDGKPRYCLWMPNCTAAIIDTMPLVKQRTDAVQRLRLASTKTATVKKAETPWRFDEVREPGEKYIGIPTVSSGRRKYVPVSFISNGMIPGNKLYFIPSSSLFDFGIVVSLFHNAWVRVVSGRFGPSYNYSNTIVYNNFIWPDPTDIQRATIETCAQAVLDTRDNYSDKSLADLYDPDKMPADLLAAHKALDAAVEAAYGVDFNGDEEKIVAHLFKLYAETTKEE